MGASFSSEPRAWASAAVLAAAAIVCAGIAGCVVPLSGTNDGAFDYVREREPSGAPVLDIGTAVSRVKARLGAAEIAADVTASDARTVRIAADLGAARAVDMLVLWRGGLSAYLVDDTFVFQPVDTSGLDARSYVRSDGQTGRWWEGSFEAITRVVANTASGPHHRVFAERLAGERFRTRVVGDPVWKDLAIGENAIESIESVEHGRALALSLGTGARAALSATARSPSEKSSAVVFACGESVLATVPLAEAAASPTILRLGEDLAAFERAYHTRRLLESPLLPPLRRVSAERVPIRWGIAAASALVPLAVSLGWLFFVRRFDRTRPEPWWLMLSTFALGGVAVIPALAIEMAWAAASPWLDPSLVTLGGQLWSLPIALPVYVLVVGLTEEASKFAAARWIATRRHEFDEPVDGIVYGCAAALGFAAVENVKYFALGRMSGALIAARSFIAVPAHMFFSAIWGFAMGRALISRRLRLAPFVAAAALAHGTFDALVSIESTQVVATWMMLPLGLAFFTFLRLALRHGAIRRPRATSAPITERLPPSELQRAYFRVGSSLSFSACAATMIATACALVTLGTSFEALHDRVGTSFIVGATLMLLTLGVAGYGAAATMPLDVAVDAHGVTFAGAMQPWGAIFDVEVTRHTGGAYVVLDSARGYIRLGPARVETAQALERVIRDTLALSRREIG